MFWTLKNPAFPEKIFYNDSKITTCKFSYENPNLIACGTHDGVILVYDITSPKSFDDVISFWMKETKEYSP